MGGEEDIATGAGDVAVFVSSSSSEQLACNVNNSLQHLEARMQSRLFNYINGPYKQHQLLVSCLDKLREVNGVDTEVKGRILRVAPNFSFSGNLVSQILWVLAICLPVIFIILSYACYMTWWVCCCAIVLSVFLSCHSVIIFIILHNNKIVKRQWFINKVGLDQYYGRENVMTEVTLDNTMTMEFLSASQKSQVISRLARSKKKKGMMMMCTRSFWISRVQDPLLCLLFLIILSLIALIINVDLLRTHYF